jgi:hypothetical protein
MAAAVGAFTLSLLAVAADKSPALKSSLIFYPPTGALSGVTTCAILLWLAVWAILEWRWKRRTLPLTRVVWISFLLLGVSFLLTFPPIGDLL